jgi:hypothetical protein
MYLPLWVHPRIAQTGYLCPTEFETFDNEHPHGSLAYPVDDVATPPLTCSSGSSSPATSSPALSSASNDDFAPPSHSRKKKAGHVPRPPNAFMCFRSEICQLKEVKGAERDNRNISRIAGLLWSNLSDEEKIPYQRQANLKKIEHAAKFPDYKYAPTSKKAVKKRKTKRDALEEKAYCRKVADMVAPELHTTVLEQRIKEEKFAVEVPSPCPATPSFLHSDPSSSPQSLCSPLKMERNSPYAINYLTVATPETSKLALVQPQHPAHTPELCPQSSTAPPHSTSYQSASNLLPFDLPQSYGCQPQVRHPLLIVMT